MEDQVVPDGPNEVICPICSHPMSIDQLNAHRPRCRAEHAPFLQMVLCLFNEQHTILQCEEQYHLEHCVDRHNLGLEVVEALLAKRKPPPDEGETDGDHVVPQRRKYRARSIGDLIYWASPASTPSFNMFNYNDPEWNAFQPGPMVVDNPQMEIDEDNEDDTGAFDQDPGNDHTDEIEGTWRG